MKSPGTTKPTNQNFFVSYQDARYMSATEGFWRIMGTKAYPIQEMKPHVQDLEVHLPGQNMAYWKSSRKPKSVAKDPLKAKSCLTEYFVQVQKEKLFPLDPEERKLRGIIGPHAYELRYHQFPT